MLYTLKNDYVQIKIESFGAELKSLISQQTGYEYIWKSDPAYWKRSSPILFPFVGRLQGQHYLHKGKTYEMGQHGFARDMEWSILAKKDESIAFLLTDNKETYKKYPFHFQLIQKYSLSGRKVTVRWIVINTDKKIMYFSIGAHPAFMCPVLTEEGMCRIQFDTQGSLFYKKLNDESLVQEQIYELPLKKGIWEFTKNVFDQDAYVFENYQIGRAAFLDDNNKPYLSVSFNAPVTGIWSPPHKNAPFVCIEPWFGRCDADNFTGELKDRQFGNSLAGGAEFAAQYEIEI